MARQGRGAGFSRVVGPNAPKSPGYVIASSRDCIKIRDQEASAIGGRDFRAVPTDDLPQHAPARSWLAAVILCPGDDTRAVAEWAAGLAPEDVDRVRFYYLPGVNITASLREWYAHGLPDPRTADVDGWESFHHEFGWDHANQVFADHRRHPEWFK